MFGTKKEEQVSQQFQLKADATGNGTVVTVRDREGKAVTGIDRATASKILTLLHEQLK
jgi:uncharacterized lipoprotein